MHPVTKPQFRDARNRFICIFSMVYSAFEMMRTILVRLTLVLTVLCCAVSLFGQRMVFKHLTVEEGLSQNTVMAITQDSLGFMWFGTRNGLCRFDGYSFRIFESNPSSEGLLSNTINSLELDSASRLWIGTELGLCLWDQSQGRILSMKSAFADDSLQGRYNIGDLFTDSRGDLWVMAGSGGFHIFRKKKGEQQFAKQISLFDPPGNNEGFYGQFTEDRQGNVWIGTSRRGIWKFDQKSSSIQPLPYASADKLAVTSLATDRQGKVWIGSLSGLYKWDETGFSLDPVSGVQDHLIRSLYVDNAGRLIVGTDNHGINIYSATTGTFAHYDEDSGTRDNLLHNSIPAIFQDS